MKSTIVEKVEVCKSNFPCIRKSIVNGMTVLFTGNNTGTVIYCGSGTIDIGTYRNFWLDHNDSAWIPVESITIKFEM